MTGEIIFTGTELLLGQILNTNAQYLQQELSALGIDLYYQITVGDNLQRCADAINQASGRADLIMIGGGLGPTEDDISREALAEALHVELAQDPAALAVVRRFFDQRGLPLSQNNLKQALIPVGGTVVDNPIGTAPGIILEREGKTYILVPGPPPEFNMMIRDRIIPFLRDKLANQVGVIQSRVLKFCGIGESLLDEKLSDLLKSSNPTLAPTAKFSKVYLRITAKARDLARAEEMIEAMEVKVRERLGSHIFGVNSETLSGVVARLIREKGKTIATLEDFTGGQLSFELSSPYEDSDIFVAGLVITGCEGLEERTGIRWGDVPNDPIDRAKHLATVLRKRFNSDIGVAVTAKRGKSGSVADHPFFIAADLEGCKMGKEVLLQGERDEVAHRAAMVTQVLLWRYLKHGIPF